MKLLPLTCAKARVIIGYDEFLFDKQGNSEVYKKLFKRKIKKPHGFFILNYLFFILALGAEITNRLASVLSHMREYIASPYRSKI